MPIFIDLWSLIFSILETRLLLRDKEMEVTPKSWSRNVLQTGGCVYSELREEGWAGRTTLQVLSVPQVMTEEVGAMD